jgi:hypothetical protein
MIARGIPWRCGNLVVALEAAHRVFLMRGRETGAMHSISAQKQIERHCKVSGKIEEYFIWS